MQLEIKYCSKQLHMEYWPLYMHQDWKFQENVIYFYKISIKMGYYIDSISNCIGWLFSILKYNFSTIIIYGLRSIGDLEIETLATCLGSI